MTIMADSEKQALLKELVELTAVPRIQPGDITVADFMEKSGIKNRSTAMRWLNDLVDEGFLETEYPVMVGNRQCRVWRRAQNGDENRPDNAP